jgi:L-threonylcarbamoyladenylate synthase
VIKFLTGRVEMVLDGGPCALGIESTVVDVTGPTPRVLRYGSLDLETLAQAVPGLVQHRDPPAGGVVRSSPGMDEKHYAPRAKLYVVSRDRLAALAGGLEQPLGVVTRDQPIDAGAARQFTLSADPVAYGAALFETLHALDDAGCRAIVLEAVPNEPRWAAVRDRLTRASAS